MTTRLESFMAARAAETYPEPQTKMHTDITEKMAPLVAALLKPGASILDVGCGQGPALEWFSKAGFYPLGTTTNLADYTACKEKNFSVRMEDMNAMGSPEEWFDCVWARHVLEHSVIPFFTLHEFARVLKPGGILYVEVPMPDTPCRHEANPNHYSVLGKDAWLCLISRTGFDIREVRKLSMMTQAGPDEYLSVIGRKP